jgi:hypothetical protein
MRVQSNRFTTSGPQLMRGSVPSLGAFSSFTQQSSSRIPHLKLHILARHSRPKSASVTERTLPLQRRCIHATPPSHSLSGIFFNASENVGQIQSSRTCGSGTNPNIEPPDAGGRDTLEEILQQAHPERVLYTLLSTTEGRGFVSHAPAESFAAALCSIDPWYLIEPFKDVYRYIKPSLATQPRYRWVRAIEQRLDFFAGQLDEIISIRRSARHRLTKDVCCHLLHCARILGNGPMARQIWQIMIPEDGVQNDLDVDAYNCYMEAICWSNAFSKTEQWRLRVTPRTLRIRRGDNPPPDLSGHRSGPLGLRHETLVYFRRMAGRGLEGNEETFTNLMVAMGREGDIAGAKSILKSVYNIDVDLLLEVDEEEVETPTFYESDSPLRPTARLLYTIAHVFGSNNHVGLAFKMVDFVSRNYDLRISFNVWMHLFDWAYVLSVRRSTAKKKQGQAIGIVPHSIIDTLWTEMTDEPHNIKPDTVMHTRLAQSLRDRGMLKESLESIQQAKKLFEGSRGQAERFGKDLLSFTDQVLSNRAVNPSQVVPAQWLDLRRRFILSSIVEDRDLQLLIVTIRLTFTEQKWPEHGRYKGWERRRLPDLIADFTEYLPNTLTYRTRGGLIEITGLKSDRVRAARSGMAMSRRNGLLRAHMDSEIATIEDLFAARRRFGAEMDEIERLGEKYARPWG